MSLSNARPTSYRRKWLSTKILQRLRQDWSIGTTKGFVVLVLAAFILTAVASSTVLSAQFQLLNHFPAT